jgi:hypothetical protein
LSSTTTFKKASRVALWLGLIYVALFGLYQWTLHDQAIALKKFDGAYARRWGDEVLTSWMLEHGDHREVSLKSFSHICIRDNSRDRNSAIAYLLVYLSEPGANKNYQVAVGMDKLFSEASVLDFSSPPIDVTREVVNGGPWSCAWSVPTAYLQTGVAP